MICFTKNKSISDMVVRAKVRGSQLVPRSMDPINIPFSGSMKGSSVPCGARECKCCPMMSKKDRVISNKNYKSYTICQLIPTVIV